MADRLADNFDQAWRRLRLTRITTRSAITIAAARAHHSMTDASDAVRWGRWLFNENTHVDRLDVTVRGTPEGIRTPNLLIRSQMLYPLSYGRTVTKSNAHEHISQSAASLWHFVYSALSSREPDPNRAPISCAIQTLCHTPRTLWAAGHSWFAGYLSLRRLATIASRRNWASPGSMSS